MTDNIPNPAPSAAAKSSLALRVKSALIFAPFVLIILAVGGGSFALMMTVAAAIGVYEWTRMVTTGQEKVPVTLNNAAAILTGFGVIVAGMHVSPVVGIFFLLALCFLLFAYNFAQQGPSLKLVVPGLIYIGFSFQTMIWLRDGSSMQGLYQFATLLLIVWSSDSFAYFTGRAIGGPKLAPAISPNKTWSGFFGSSIGAGLVAAGLSFVPVLLDRLDMRTIGGLGWMGYFAMGFVFGAAGQAGDLLISYFKRRFGIKDTGSLIPGHGGILDRVDALLLVALLFGALAWVLK
jgi:phosphatidate cytidylyltransferase